LQEAATIMLIRGIGVVLLGTHAFFLWRRKQD
jgi:hypothetical protein